MARIKGAQNRTTRKRKLMARAKGFHGTRKNTLRQAHQAVMKAQSYAYRGRKERKRLFRRLWIVRINAALNAHDLRYGQFIHGLKLAEIDINRKVLADLALTDPAAFAVIVGQAKAALA